ncbi:UvrD-helicase domain-containing protein [Cobetia sp. MMG027]|uniref:UvrD-helicase domain-containing protein n=1 Tax=Cobetia sp. MMG027 TaxID=3021980 RepID=UPI0022FE9B28|nr:UvrD-helicase domain-containing protein [Cobetia sp. MMG027]MDA5563099.1 UvrD-helicase domain-containing protein [Cobetia sp. MMG027]
MSDTRVEGMSGVESGVRSGIAQDKEAAMSDEMDQSQQGQALDIPTLPLLGQHLIEASAGTGKTFTLAALYVRLVLGPLPGQAASVSYPRPLTPPEILVVTFTEAATAELRDRIRARLKQAREALLGRASPDPILAELLAPLLTSSPAEDASRLKAAAARRLDQAARLMDDAAIFTIHGFCQRMLSRHAFDAGGRFGAELLQDGQSLLTRCVEDYWRCEFYPLAREWQALIRGRWAGPEALGEELRGLLRDGTPRPLYRDGECLEAPQDLSELLGNAEQWRQQQEAARRAVEESFDEPAIRDVMGEAFASKALNGNSYKEAELEPRLAATAAWLASGEHDFAADMLDSKKLCWLSQAKLEKGTKKNCQTPRHPFFAALDLLAEVPAPDAVLLDQVAVHARDSVARALICEKRRLGLWEFSDLLNDLDHALDPSLNGEASQRLARQVRRELPVAMIDEFQDTDPVQYRIFRRIYPQTAGDGSCDGPLDEQHVDATDSDDADEVPSTLLMIGDPKQAIYAFRGADIDTYLAARQVTPSRFTLPRNFRSSAAMVAAVNALFAQHPAPFGSEDIPFQPVEAQGTRTRLVLRHPDGREEAACALNLWWANGERLSADAHRRDMSRACRTQIQTLLEGQQRLAAGEPGLVFMDAGDSTVRGVAASDIAVLVRNGREAAAVRGALAEGGIRSVYLSEKSSVFDTPEAFELLQLFEAVAHPRDDRRLRAALATRLLADDLSLVERLVVDELAWEREVERFDGYHRDWQRRGVLPMLRGVMRDFRVGERLAARAGGERALTDVLHLGELAQNAAQRLDGEQALLRWWHQALESGHEALDSDSLSQRLESDEGLVRVVTIHKSKGLEYPIVLLPFMASFRAAEPDRNFGLLTLKQRWLAVADVGGDDQGGDDQGGDDEEVPARRVDQEDDALDDSILVKKPSKEAIAAADHARLMEDVRLLYVALTRPKFACWLGLAPIGKGGFSKQLSLPVTAIGYLLGMSDNEEIEASAIEAALCRWCEQQSAGLARVSGLPELPGHDYQPPAERDQHFHGARHFAGGIEDDWWIASYTALLTDARQVTAALEDTGDAEDDRVPEGATEIALEEGEQGLTRPDREVAGQSGPLLAGGLPMTVGEIHLHDFPRGPRPGTFLHGLLEAVDLDRLGADDYRGELERLVGSRLHFGGFDASWQPRLTDWLEQALTRPLQGFEGEPILLNRLDAWQPELEFWLPAVHARSLPLDAVVTALEPLPRSRPRLAPRRMHGMLKGFIDLTFQSGGRWYVLDWKSNYLGERPEDYLGESLARAMVEHRYDLQYVLYTLALHRLLKARLGEDYDYERCMGGVLYVFLRGLDAGGDSPALAVDETEATPGRPLERTATPGVFQRRPSQALIEALDLWLGGDSSALDSLLLHTTDTSPLTQSGQQGAFDV